MTWQNTVVNMKAAVTTIILMTILVMTLLVSYKSVMAKTKPLDEVTKKLGL